MQERIEKILDKFSYNGVSGYNKIQWGKEVRDEIASEITKFIEEEVLTDFKLISKKIDTIYGHTFYELKQIIDFAESKNFKPNKGGTNV